MATQGNTDTDYGVQLQIKNHRGEDAPVDGDIVWTSSDETQLLPVPDPGGRSGKIKTIAASPNGPDGNPIPARVTFTGDADMGAGVVPIVGVTDDITLTTGPNSQASTFDVVLTDVPKEPPAAGAAGGTAAGA